MKHSSAAASLCFFLGLAVAANGASSSQRQARQAQTPPPAAAQPPQQQQVINLSLVDALVAINEEGLAGIFGYIAEPNAAPAFAEYLFRTPRALKLFIKKGERDLKAAAGINEWDKEVYLYIVSINATGSSMGIEPLPEKVLDKVSTLSLAPGLPLAAITMKRKR